MHALIIEDDAYSIEVLGNLLSQEGIEFTALSDARKVEEAIRVLPPVDIVFLDLELPWTNGYEVYELLGTLLPAETRIIACSVHTNEIQTVRELGFHSFIAKPLDMDRFPMQIQRILNNHSVWEV
jgi:DNA-binding response OmpR family regulator